MVSTRLPPAVRKDVALEHLLQALMGPAPNRGDGLFLPDPSLLWAPELDTFYAHSYSLTRDELRAILNPAGLIGPDYPSETVRVLKNNEQRQFGEYSTHRLVLEAWDRLFGG